MLFGPSALEITDVEGSTRRALDAWQAGTLLELNGRGPRRPGLYLMLEGGSLTGVWLVLGPSWVDRGDPGDDVVPPCAGAVLNALTEAIWWSRLKVHPRQDRGSASVWRPVVVLEWPPPLASRAAVNLPGEPVPERYQEAPEQGAFAEGEGEWLRLDEDRPAPVVDAELNLERDRGAPSGLPPSRSALTVVRGELRASSGRHRARFAMVPVLGEPGVPTADWLTTARETPTPDAAPSHTDGGSTADPPRLGGPLLLPGGGVGFAMAGWLDRRLVLRPAIPADIQAGTLHDRDVGGLMRARIEAAGKLSIALFLAVLLVALLVWRVSEPRVDSNPPPALTRPQPALSLCSVDNIRFVEELRCQITALSQVTDGTGRSCRDGAPPGSDSRPKPAWQPEAVVDVQPLWCGLRDRELDGWREPTSGAAWANLAAAQACFNVLGAPETYRSATAMHRPNVTAFFDERKLRIEPLVDLVEQLDTACLEVGRRARRQVEGAILATHIGDSSLSPTTAGAPGPESGSEAGRLRAELGKLAGRSLGGVERRCLLEGVQRGAERLPHYAHLCGEGGKSLPLSESWTALGPLGPTAPEPLPDARPLDVIERYTDARFATVARPELSPRAVVAKAEPTWRCHMGLTTGPVPLLAANGDREAPTSAPLSPWDLTLPIPRRYHLPGESSVRDQLLLDAGLNWLRARGDAGVCWRVVQARLNDYTPVHPLFSARAVESWPSEEQQLCGQICAGWFRVADPDRRTEWLTPDRDLARCVDGRPLKSAPAHGGAGFDALRLPWNADRRGEWVPPSASEICAFNLVAQGWLTGGPVPLPVDGAAPQRWAGEDEAGSQIAGGRGALAVEAALALDSYGGQRSSANCAYVATQCATTQVLDAMAHYPERPFNWAPDLSRRLAGLADNGERVSQTPWCRLIRPYLPRTGTRPDGRLDFPCATAVEESTAASVALVEVLSGKGELAEAP